MKEYHVTVMSIDPNDDSEDPHQKYGITLLANNDTDAKTKGESEFKSQHPNLPIFWIKVYPK